VRARCLRPIPSPSIAIAIRRLIRHGPTRPAPQQRKQNALHRLEHDTDPRVVTADAMSFFETSAQC